MGGDHAPAQTVRGALMAVRELECDVALVGRTDRIAAELVACGARDQVTGGRITVIEAPDVIAMDDHNPASAARHHRGASVVRACGLVAEGRAAAAVSAGNSGATLAAALITVKRADGVARPAIGAVLPSLHGRTFLLDAGANAECKPAWLAQFAVMGSIYARTMMGVATPRVGLLSNGEEPGKGPGLVQAAAAMISRAPVTFVGNVEGRDLFRGACDVAVTDGFTGNIALKTAEGVAELLFATLRREASSGALPRLGGLLLRPRLRAVRDRVDYRRTGGALLLGAGGEVVIAHGRSDAVAIMNAIRVAQRAAAKEISRLIGEEVGGTEMATPEAAAGTMTSI